MVKSAPEEYSSGYLVPRSSSTSDCDLDIQPFALHLVRDSACWPRQDGIVLVHREPGFDQRDFHRRAGGGRRTWCLQRRWWPPASGWRPGAQAARIAPAEPTATILSISRRDTLAMFLLLEHVVMIGLILPKAEVLAHSALDAAEG